MRAAVAQILDQFRLSVRAHVRKMVWMELTERAWFNTSIFYLVEGDYRV